MASSKGAKGLFEAVKQLPPDQLAQFAERFSEWSETSPSVTSDSLLIQRTRRTFPAADARRFRQLARKSERKELTPSELAEYQELAERGERMNAVRIAALAELARRRQLPVEQVMSDIGWQDLVPGQAT